MRALVLVVLLTPALAGCIQGATVEPALALGAGGGVALGDAAATDVVGWTGKKLVAIGNDGPPMGLWPVCIVMSCFSAPACETANCERTTFRIDAPEDGWGEGETVQVRAQSVRNFTVSPYLRVLDAKGDVVAKAAPTDWISVVELAAPPSGEYVAEVLALFGEGVYEAAIVVPPPPTPAVTDGLARDLLPNLVTLRPSDLRIETPGDDIDAVLLPALGAKGCAFDEAVEAQARRCLRFSNGVANVGEGALEVRLSTADAVGSFAGASRFVQRIHQSDGSAREEPVGGATFHPMHAHYHYAGLATYELFAFDVETGTRGEKVGEGRKAGFCFYDTAMVDIRRADVQPQAYDGRGCFDPTASAEGDSWYTGVSPGYADFYGWYLSDQYVEITGLPDGDYELVTVADGNGTLVESDTSDNAASAVFRLAGDEVVVLETTGA